MTNADTGPAKPGFNVVAAPAAADREGAFDLVVLGGSAGGLAAVNSVLLGLPPGFAAPLIVMLHLPPDFDPSGWFRRQPLPVECARPGAALKPGTMLVCPPRSFVELLPDGTCVLSPCEGGAMELPIDRLLESIARSFGDRALGVVLTGMGSDAAAGALEIKRAGGFVLVQAPESAEYPAMPRAAIAGGAATMVLPLGELGHVIGELVNGTPRQRLRSEVDAIGRTFGEQGEVAAWARELDWSRTALGAVVGWPDELRVMARMVVESLYPAAVWWGPQLIQIYNAPWRQFLGPRQHPRALGAPAWQTWTEIWHEIEPMIERVLSDGASVGREDYPVLVEREGLFENIFVTFSYAPVRDAAGAVVGVYNTAWETTRDVVSERRLEVLRELALQMSGADSVRGTCELAISALATAPQEAPLALLYVVDAQRRQAVLAGSAGVEPGAQAAPRVVTLSEDATPWPLARVMEAPSAGTRPELQLDHLGQRCPGLPPIELPRAGALPPCTALLLPVRTASDKAPIAVLVLGLNPHRRFDETYRSFVDLMVEQIAAGIAQALLREQEHERVERLAELDRAKTQFFANVSHEFRTPLTLLLAPLEELLRRRELLPALLVDEVDTAARNARRLLTLVTNLLDFSQIESTRRRAYLEPHDLAVLTADIVSHFRSAVERAGLRLNVNLAENLPPVPVDPEMWTKVVSNLLLNAFKFTFEGEISVTLKSLRLHAELIVADTGVGIPEHELPHLFKRFHRVRGARARTAEGAGIGLSIVQDLVNRMGGQLQVRSWLGKGTAFTIWLPYKSFRQTGEPPDAGAAVPPTAAAALADEALRWLPNDSADLVDVAVDLLGLPASAAHPGDAPAVRARIVVVDDNADMRDFLRRLLVSHWDIETATDGETGLAAARRQRPEAIVADVMMPGTDGFELLRRVRADPALQRTPVILLTARAGETAAIEGLRAGADDCVAKPFSPRELVARLRTVIERARADAALRASEQRFRLFVTAASDIVYRMSADWTRMLALEGKDFLADTHDSKLTWLEEYIPDSDKAFVQAAIADAVRRRTTFVLEHHVIRADGTLGWVFSRAIPFLDDRGDIIEWFGAASDITERKRAEEALREREACRRGQREAMEAALNGEPLDVSLGALVSTAVQAFGGDTRAAIYLADDDGATLRHVTGMGEAYAQAVDGFAIGPESHACGLAMHTGRPVITYDVNEEPRWQSWLWLARQFDYRGCWSFPVRAAGGKLIGSLAIYWRQPRAATERDLELAALLTDTASIVISHHVELMARQQAERALRASEQRMAHDLGDAKRLQTIASMLIEEGDADAIHEKIVEAAMLLMQSDSATVQWLDDDGDLRLLASKGLHPDSAVYWQRVSIDDDTSCGTALKNRQRFIARDVEQRDVLRGTELLRQYRLCGIRATQSTPLTSRDGRIIGMLSTHWRRPHEPGERDLALLDLLARQAADALERSHANGGTARQ